MSWWIQFCCRLSCLFKVSNQAVAAESFVVVVLDATFVENVVVVVIDAYFIFIVLAVFALFIKLNIAIFTATYVDDVVAVIVIIVAIVVVVDVDATVTARWPANNKL